MTVDIYLIGQPHFLLLVKKITPGSFCEVHFTAYRGLFVGGLKN